MRDYPKLNMGNEKRKVPEVLRGAGLLKSVFNQETNLKRIKLINTYFISSHKEKTSTDIL
jgi:hypothetical protein